MIFRFDLSQSELLSIPVDVINNAVSELLRAHRNGLHLFVIPRDVGLFLLTILDLNEREKSLVRRLISEFTQTNGLTARATVFASIRKVDAIQRMGGIISLPLSDVSHSLVGNPCGLLIENSLYDGTIYSAIIGSLRTTLKTPNVCVAILNGGGDGIYADFRRHVEARVLLLCILDSDRMTPFEPLPPKLKELTEYAEAAKWPFARAVALPCHELENVIPRSIVYDLPSAVSCRWNVLSEKISGQEILQNVDCSERFWMFLDLKNGLSSQSFNKISEQGRSWIADRLKVIGIMTAAGDTWDIAGYGHNMIKQVIDDNLFMARLGKEVREKDWLSHFSAFFEEVIWYFAAATPINT